MAKNKDNVIVRLSSWFFVNWKYTMLLWLLLIGGGATIYSNIITREGFPSINFPISVVSGTYFVDDVNRIDKEVTKPISDALTYAEGVDSVNATAGSNFFTFVVRFDNGINPVTGTRTVRSVIDAMDGVPEQAVFSYKSLDPAAFLNEYDMLLSVYSNKEKASAVDLERVSEYIAGELRDDPIVANAKTLTLLETGINPATNKKETRQTKYNQIGAREDGDLKFHQAITIGIDRNEELADIIELSDFMNDRLASLDLSRFNNGDTKYTVAVSADFAESITADISSLQSNLLTGLIAVSIVSLLLITWRASIITGLFMITVVVTTISVLYIIGYSLNTITLFALVLSLGLFVDDATIVVESIDVGRNKKKKPLEIVRSAIRRIGGASFAGTFTTVLVFLPLAFLNGILGEFIRLMPITIIIALITSLVLSLTVIPLLSRFFLLKHTKDSWLTRVNPLSKLEIKTAEFVGKLPRLLKTNPKKGKVVAILMLSLSFAVFSMAMSFAGKLSLNIFPPTKDSNKIGYVITYPEGYTLQQAEEVANQLNTLVETEIGDLAESVLYGNASQPNARSSDALIKLVHYNDRSVKSPELIGKLQAAADNTIDKDVTVRVIQYDAGPPIEEFPLKIQIVDEDLKKATSLADEVRTYLMGASVTRANGQPAKITDTRAPSVQTINRADGDRTLTVQAAFDADDTSALVVAAQEYVEDKFTNEYLQSKGYDADVLGFDFGQETDNAESFAALAWAFPLALLSMFILLALQFRSFLQPLLIFMAIPFTFLGVFGGLYLTDNALSFFVQVGLVGLIGIAVNNTILLTDYANQERRAGAGAVDAIANAATKRFRPLITTTLTTVVALLPLALSDPFWEALAFTIIFGLISSTFLVVLSFPYYYLAAEWVRTRVSRADRKARKSAKAN